MMLNSFSDAQVNNLCVHYKDTFEIHLKSIKQRDFLFYALLCIISLFIVHIFSVDTIHGTIGIIVKDRYGIDMSSYINKIYTFLWCILFGVMLKYFQTILHIERQYKYIKCLEDILCKIYPESGAFTRESTAYANNYPKTLNFIFIVYGYIFPIIFLICISAKILFEWKTCSEIGYLLIPDTIAYLAIITTTTLYIFDRSKN